MWPRRNQGGSHAQSALNNSPEQEHREPDQKYQGQSREEINGQDNLDDPGGTLAAINIVDGLVFRRQAGPLAFYNLDHVHHSFFYSDGLQGSAGER